MISSDSDFENGPSASGGDRRPRQHLNSESELSAKL